MSPDDTSGAFSAGEVECTVRILRRQVATIDDMWREAGARAEFSEWAMALGEASHVMHRALIALDLQLQDGVHGGLGA